MQTGPEANPATFTVSTGSFPGVRRRRRGADHPPLSTAEDANGLQLYLRLPSVGAMACHAVTFTFIYLRKYLSFVYGPG